MLQRERGKGRSIPLPLYLNQQALRLTIKMVWERRSSYLHSVPCSLLNEGSLGQSSGVTWRRGGRGKVWWLVFRLFAPKRPSRIREIWRRNFSFGQKSALEWHDEFSQLRGKSPVKRVELCFGQKSSLEWHAEFNRLRGKVTHKKSTTEFGQKTAWEPHAEFSWLQERHSPVKRRERNLNIENPSKISTTQTVFLLQFFSIRKWYVSKERETVIKFIEWTQLQASVWRLRHFSQVREKERKKKEKEEKRTVERHFCLMFSSWLNILLYFKKKREKKRELFLKSHPYLFGRRILKFCYILNAPLCWNLLVVLFPLSIWLLLHVSCCSLVPLSSILAKRLIASLKHYKIILETCLQLILSNLEVCSSMIWEGRKTKDLVVYVKVNWHPLTNVWGQFSPYLTSTLFVCLSYARNRSFDRDLFCGVSSAKLPSTLDVHKMGQLFMQHHNKNGFGVNNLQWLMCHKTKPNQTKPKSMVLDLPDFA